jgi:4a-hydroxytetrahydrobiopterin dehydratase
MTASPKLQEKRCVPCEGGTPPLDLAAAQALREQLDPRWKISDDARRLTAEFGFRNYFRTLAFINAAAYVAIQEDHHPDITFGYNTCTISWWTHSVNGLSENDFICAAKVDQLANS